MCEPCRATGVDVGDDPPEEYRELFRVAQQLLRLGITDEAEVLPTLHLAALAGFDPPYKQMYDKVVEAGEGSGPWTEMQRFANAFYVLEPRRIRDGVIIFRRAPVDVESVVDEAEETVEEIHIKVHEHSIEARDVELLYSSLLTRHGLSTDADRGC